jgi:hypothetical protein
MSTVEIIETLKEGKVDFSKIDSLSKSPGIYAIFFKGDSFPILGNSVSKDQIIYIGNSDFSQDKKDVKTHFISGKTNSSTVRKSIGSILQNSKNLLPIPRNESDYSKGRFSHFIFDKDSEEAITYWMKYNLVVSFIETPKSEIKEVESNLIDKLVPVLNLTNNDKNTFRITLQQLHKNCATIALNNSNFQIDPREVKS